MGEVARRVLRLAGVGAALGAAGCWTYTAPMDRTVTRGQVSVDLETATGTPDSTAELVLRLRTVPAKVRLKQASATSGAVICGGVRAVRLGRSSGASLDAPLVPGERLTLAFGSAGLEALSAKAPRVDLIVRLENGEHRCIPIPLTAAGGTLPWRTNERFTVGVDLSIEGYTARLGAVSQVVTAPLMLGAWIGSYHLEAGGGIAGAGCPEDRCTPPSQRQRINYANSAVLVAGVRRSVFETGSVSMGAALRYRAQYLAADTRTGRESFWAHGPLFAPYIGVTPPVSEQAKWRGGAREALIGFEVPVGYVFAENGESSPSIGVNLTFMTTAF